jgi:hypothetical protein
MKATDEGTAAGTPWNKGKLTGPKAPLKLKENLGHPDPSPAFGASPRPRNFQLGD